MPRTEQKSLAEQIEDYAKRSGVSETHEENYGHEGDIRRMLDRAASQRTLDEAIRSRFPAPTD